MGCPYCGTGNNWQICPKCGFIQCNTCGKDQYGSQRRAANVCGSCDYVGNFSYTQTAPPWGR